MSASILDKPALGIVFLALSASCAVMPPGEGRPGVAAQARLDAQLASSRRDAALRASVVAQKSGDAATASKALTLVSGALNDRALSTNDAATAARPVLGHLECGDRARAASLLEDVKDPAGASDYLLATMKQCPGKDAIVAAISAGRIFKESGRCGEAILAVRSVWPEAYHDQAHDLFRSVEACSDDGNRRANLLEVAPAKAVDDYLAEEKAEEARAACKSQCDDAMADCVAGCPAHGPRAYECGAVCGLVAARCGC